MSHRHTRLCHYKRVIDVDQSDSKGSAVTGDPAAERGNRPDSKRTAVTRDSAAERRTRSNSKGTAI